MAIFGFKAFGAYERTETGKTLMSCDDVTTGDLILDYAVRRLTPHEQLRSEHEAKFGVIYPCGYLDYCDYCDQNDRDTPCAKAKLRMENEA